MKILAIDLGTDTGVAHNLGGSLTAFTHKLATATEITQWGKQRLNRRCDPRIQRLADFLKGLPKPDLVTYEDVQFSKYTLQTQLWSSFRAAVWLTFGQTCILECVDVKTLKKFATGSGAADKPAMLRALKIKHPELLSCLKDQGDDSIDALWIYQWAKHNLARMCLPTTAKL